MGASLMYIRPAVLNVKTHQSPKTDQENQATKHIELRWVQKAKAGTTKPKVEGGQTEVPNMSGNVGLHLRYKPILVAAQRLVLATKKLPGIGYPSKWLSESYATSLGQSLSVAG
ncbi:hypothetical protein PoB_002809900 [Plakobranchus ocellatus]|uniref:Uncharacterized protein n=1 Tax=Plakobranchus ocellatus TaxID=259542 RepID=A0AAV4A1V0_9GAST|nr:hypothetical protein PoB_002809900 [Plakobranchus ocellatus]